MSLVRFRSEAPICGRSSSGRAPPCQGGGSEFEPRRPLQKAVNPWVRGFFAGFSPPPASAAVCAAQFAAAQGAHGRAHAGTSHGRKHAAFEKNYASACCHRPITVHAPNSSAVHGAHREAASAGKSAAYAIRCSRRAWAGTSVFALPPAGTWACASAAAVRPACRSRRDGLQEEESARRGGAEGFAVLRENCFQNWKFEGYTVLTCKNVGFRRQSG